MPTRLFALGSNGAGQLGIGNTDDVSIPTKCLFDPVLRDGETIARIRAGGNHSVLLTSEGRAYAAGSITAIPPDVAKNNSFQLLQIEKLFNLSSTSKLTDIAASWDASYFVIDKQVVYACGTGNKGELGVGAGVPLSVMPQVLLDLGVQGDGSSVVRTICGGPSHVVLLTSDGDVYGWGTSRKGELGEDAKDDKIVWRPRKIEIGFPASQVVTGRNFTFVCGTKNQQAVLGDSKYLSAIESLEFSATTEFTCGWSTLYALASGKMQAVGRGDRGQIPPVQLPPLVHFAAGSEHSIGCSNDGDAIAFGWGEHGNCGEPIDSRGTVTRRFNTISIPKRVGEVISLIAAGCATTFIAVTSTTEH